MFVKAWLPHEVELPQAVQRNANGDRVIISVENYDGVTTQVVFENDDVGDMIVTLRGWGNMPQKVGNMDNTRFRATVQQEPQTNCEICGRHLKHGERCSCTS